MAQSSPIAPPRGEKRLHSTLDGDGDSDDNILDNGSGAPQIPVTVNENISAAATRYMERKRLKPDQKAEVNAFLHDPASIREVKLLVNLMVVQSQIDKIITTTAPWQPSEDLLKNIDHSAAAVLLSSKIRTYKGTTPTNIVVEILKKYRFDLPAGIEHNPADFSKVIGAIQEALTQKRSKFKKLIIHSLKPHDHKSVENAPKANQLNIFQLTTAFVDGTRCSVSVPVCARVALMRKVYLKEPGKRFWDAVDEDLVKIRKKAGGDSKKIIRAFRHILENDQEGHGVTDYDLRAEDETVDGYQQEIDEVSDANLADAASTV
ncbi:hypothetical protein B0H14DRAFT_3868840 [Mycena olivaceomarginata]|nr:hypothetical protein B0H14DRAFT_3868840 [Mycena olivaceomarginata]